MNLKILAKELHLKVASVQVLRLLFIQASPSLPMTCSLLNVNTNIGPIKINIPTDNLFNAKLLTKVLELSYANVPTVCSVTPSNSNK